MNNYLRKIVLIFFTIYVSINLNGQNWTVNPADYEFNGEICAIVFKGTNEISGKLGAFVGETCRGISETGRTLMCYSNKPRGEMITFKLSSDSIYDIIESIEFVSNMVEGNRLHPLQFHIKSPCYAVSVLTQPANTTMCSVSGNASF